MGEKIDADEEERKEEIFKERRHVTREFRQGFVEAKPEYESSRINLVRVFENRKEFKLANDDYQVSLGKGLDQSALIEMAHLARGRKGGQ